jgi:hypothetical protein
MVTKCVLKRGALLLGSERFFRFCRWISTCLKRSRNHCKSVLLSTETKYLSSSRVCSNLPISYVTTRVRSSPHFTTTQSLTDASHQRSVCTPICAHFTPCSDPNPALSACSAPAKACCIGRPQICGPSVSVPPFPSVSSFSRSPCSYPHSYLSQSVPVPALLFVRSQTAGSLLPFLGLRTVGSFCGGYRPT